MRITSVEAIPIGYPEPNDHGRTRYVCLVRVETDEGLVGWGEGVAYWEEAAWATATLIDALAVLVVGMDPVQSETIWRKLREHAWWYGNGGIASIAIAGIDLAVWDLKGKALGARVLDLLGGPTKEALPAIASGHASNPDLGALADEAAGWVSNGIRGLKVGFGKRGDARLGYEHARDVEYVRRVREAIGPDKSIMIDLGVAIRWDVTEAVERVRAFEEHNIAWIEEPLGHWDPAGYRTLRAKTTTRIAYGEKEFGLEGIQRILDTGTCDVLGFDPGRTEGLTAIVSAASLAMSWAAPVCRQFEVKPIRDVAQFEFVAAPLTPVDGFMPQLVGHGLGIEILEDVVARYRL